jgi:hypothetical protein
VAAAGRRERRGSKVIMNITFPLSYKESGAGIAFFLNIFYLKIYKNNFLFSKIYF